MDGVIRDACGVFAVWGHPEAVRLTYYGLYALQHRGQESAGIAAAENGEVSLRRGMGLVSEALGLADLAALSGSAAIGHVRYSTTGASTPANAQPLLARLRFGPVALGHNGNLTNAAALRAECEAAGSILQTDTDTEVVLHLMARSGLDDPAGALCAAVDRIQGAFSLVALAPDRILVARDPHGIRPLALGRLGEAWLAASETCALDAVGATFEREVEPGEVAEMGAGGLRTLRRTPAPHPALCLFEFIYLARPDSELLGRNVHLVRKEMGRRLAREAPVDADVVVGVPDSGISAATGFAEEACIPYELGLIKNRYIGRTFIQPSQGMREVGVRLKLNAVRGVVRDRRVVLVDDSVVRGTTSRRLVDLLRAAGARQVHLRISAPPFVHPCFYGIDIPSADQLLAGHLGVAEMAAAVGADSLAFLSQAAAAEASGAAGGLCTACFSGRYPVPAAAEVYR